MKDQLSGGHCHCQRAALGMGGDGMVGGGYSVWLLVPLLPLTLCVGTRLQVLQGLLQTDEGK